MIFRNIKDMEVLNVASNTQFVLPRFTRMLLIEITDDYYCFITESDKRIRVSKLANINLSAITNQVEITNFHECLKRNQHDGTVVRTCSYTVTEKTYSNGSKSMNRTNDGYSPIELLGITALIQQEIYEQIKGHYSADVIIRQAVIDGKE